MYIRTYTDLRLGGSPTVKIDSTHKTRAAAESRRLAAGTDRRRLPMCHKSVDIRRAEATYRLCGKTELPPDERPQMLADTGHAGLTESSTDREIVRAAQHWAALLHEALDGDFLGADYASFLRLPADCPWPDTGVGTAVPGAILFGDAMRSTWGELCADTTRGKLLDTNHLAHGTWSRLDNLGARFVAGHDPDGCPTCQALMPGEPAETLQDLVRVAAHRRALAWIDSRRTGAQLSWSDFHDHGDGGLQIKAAP